MNERPKTAIDVDNEHACYKLINIDPLRNHDNNGSRQHIASIYDYDDAVIIMNLWNKSI